MSEKDLLAAGPNDDSSDRSLPEDSSKDALPSAARSLSPSPETGRPDAGDTDDAGLLSDTVDSLVSAQPNKPDARTSRQAPPYYPPIPSKRYFTIGEISHLCKVPQHVLRYWERFFPELKPSRRQNHRYYSHQHVYLVRHIDDLLKRQGFTISGARRQLTQGTSSGRPDYSKQIIRKVRQELEEMLKQAKL